MFRKRFQLGLLHVALGLTALPPDSTLNRLMIHELGISATLAAALVSLPYLFAPMQLVIGSFADRHPLLGRHRTPYILIGVLLSVAGVWLAPAAVYTFAENATLGVIYSALAFGLWGTGFNFAAVSYFSLASELSGEEGRSGTIATMYFMLILSMIAGGISLGRALTAEPPQTVVAPQTVITAVRVVAGIALAVGILGLIGLEPHRDRPPEGEESFSLAAFRPLLAENRTARRFFVYMLLLLAAILGQDVILEPYAAEAFNMTVDQTTRLTSIYGTFLLVALVSASQLERRLSKHAIARLSSWGAVVAFALIAGAGLLKASGVFYGGLCLLGLAIGVSTVANHSLMLDMTTPQNVGLFIGAWGMATAFARLVGQVLGGLVRDGVAQLALDPATGYVAVFAVEIAMLLASLYLLRQIDVGRFRQAAEEPVSVSAGD